MSQTPKKKRRKLPKNIVEKTDAEVAEMLFGKRLKRALDAEISKSTPAP